MMIHVFYVNKGDMLTFDMSLAMQSVAKLKEAIQRDLSIPVSRQVLLVNGGEDMLSDERVNTYSAGTDTCPIYLFNLKAIEEKYPTERMQRLDRDSIKLRVDGSINMAPTLATLTTRTQLALDLREVGENHEIKCKRLVHEQHLQHQGWRAVVANMEDSLKAFEEEADVFISWYKQFLERKGEREEMLRSFPESLRTLSKMPILASLSDVLTKSALRPGGAAAASDSDNSLLSFFINVEDRESLATEAELLLTELTQVNAELLEHIQSEKEKVLEVSETPGMKEVRGLENRLSGLEQLIIKAGQLVKEQQEYAQGFVHNQKRCRQLADPHVLPDLCISHKQQLRNMEGIYEKLMNILERCRDTKHELCSNLHARLRWTMYVEKVMSDLDGRIALQFEGFKRLKFRIDRIEQIARAPAVYAQLCAEVYRRRAFNAAYLKWNKGAYGKATDWHSKEVEYRKSFYQGIGNHCLKSFFPGLDKLPPTAVVSQVTEIDEHLPHITEQEISSLKTTIPELEPWLMVNDGNDDSTLVSLVSTLSPETPSDIVVLSPRNNHSSHGSLAKALSLSLEPHIMSQHTAPSTLDSLTSNSASDAVVFPHQPPGGAVADSNGSLEHMMDKFESFEEDEASANTDDEFGPASLSEENSAVFTTAYPGEFESMRMTEAPSDRLSQTVEMQNADIKQLMAENKKYKEECDRLNRLVQEVAGSALQQLQQLKESGQLVRQNVVSTGSDLDTLQRQIKDAIEHVSSKQEVEVEERLSMQRSAHEREMSQLLEVHKAREAEVVKELRLHKQDYGELLMQVEKVKLDREAEIASAVEKAEAAVSERLTKKHQSHLEDVKCRAVADIETLQSELDGRDSEIKRLHLEVQELHERIRSDAASAEDQMSDLRTELSDIFQRKLAEVKAEHKRELQEVSESQQLKVEDKLSEQLVEQASRLNREHQLEVEKIQATADEQLKSCESSYQQQIEKVKAECKRENEETLEVKGQLEVKLWQQWEAREKELNEQCQQRLDSQEAEFEYRAAKMKEALQIANEMKYQNKLQLVEKEKDMKIVELKRKLSHVMSSSQVMAESVVTVEPTSVTDSQLLQDQLTQKDSVIKSLQQQLNVYSMSASSREMISSDKVTVKSCSNGDKVILCYDERYKHYVVFSLSATTYFVHSESLSELGLDPTLPEDQRKTWLLAEVIDKEYCQAKKANNRFNVPVNTKFYRVKAKPWNI